MNTQTMTATEQWDLLEDMSQNENLTDNENPAFMFATTSIHVLTAIANGTVDPVVAAKRELANRGLNANGAWVGFAQAEELLKN